MGLHHEHLHAAAHEARDSLGKRDSTNFHIPIEDNKYRFVHIVGKLSDEFKAHGDNFAPKGVTDDSDAGVVTVTRQVYVTEPKTFAGPAVYITKTTEVIQQGERTALPTMNSFESAKSAIHANTHRHQNSYESAKSLIQQSRTRSTAKNTITSNSNSLPTSGSVVKGSPITNDGTSQQSNGMSSGGKAGLAIGILAIIGLVAALAFFCVRRSKKRAAARGEKLDEKHASQNSFFSGTAAAVGAPAGNKRDSVRTMNSTHTAATAPRLSLRPVTQFLPNLAGPAMSEKPRNGPAQNPFSDPSRRSPSPAANPFEEGDGQGIKQGAAAVAAPASAGRPQNNVHRIQLDFKPSMDDELELKSGQLVRMLHEYDDGWALCIRMDRSQQGVCPRTCLSKLAVKPRPQGPPPQGRAGGSPPGFRGAPPQGLNKMVPRPLTPTGRERSSTAGGRAPSPAQESARPRSQSSSAADRTASPVDNAVPARKPVPGQAL